jgi:hypothetical protein
MVTTERPAFQMSARGKPPNTEAASSPPASRLRACSISGPMGASSCPILRVWARIGRWPQRITGVISPFRARRRMRPACVPVSYMSMCG